MKNKYVKSKGSVLIYTLVLVVISLIMALVILGIAWLLASNAELQEIRRKLSNNVLANGKLSLKYSKIVNSNGSGFTDTLWCPTNVTMSGTVAKTITTPALTYQSGSIFCKGTHGWDTYKIYFLSGSISDTITDYGTDSINVTAGVGDRPFFDTDHTKIDYSSSLPTSSDGIDDDFDSDNYLVSSTGATLYPSGYQDDDTDARKLLYGYANPWVGFVKMLWSNTETANYIEANTNNTGSLNEKIGSMTGTWVALLDINQAYKMKVYTLDKTVYDTTKEILPTQVYESSNLLGTVWYLQEVSGILSLTWSITGDEFEFDFTNNDYALFINNNSTGALLYTLRIETTTGTGVYINAIDDSSETVLKSLANDIIIDNQWRFLYEQFEVIDFK